MHQLDLWNHAAPATAAPSVRRPRVATPRLTSGMAPEPLAPTVCLDPELVPEVPHDPELLRLRARAGEFVRQARAGTTRKAYCSDWKFFEAWCALHGEQALPAAPETLALYLTQLAERGRKYSTIRRARTAIGQVHAAARLARPDLDARVRTLERGIGRTIGTREQGAQPLCVAELARAVGTLHDSTRDVRDRALILLGFAGGYRASDLALLDCEHIRIEQGVLQVFLPRSKEDQLGRGRTTRIRAADNLALCPLRALERWLDTSPYRQGPLFRVVSGARIEPTRIHPRAVTRAVQRATKRAELAGDYSAHSLRAGLATSASARGHALRAIQEHVGWLDARTPSRYIHGAHAAGEGVLSGLL